MLPVAVVFHVSAQVCGSLGEPASVSPTSPSIYPSLPPSLPGWNNNGVKKKICGYQVITG